MSEELWEQSVTVMMDFYHEVMEASAHNIEAMEKQHKKLPAGSVKDEYDRVIEGHLNLMELMKQEWLELSKEADSRMAMVRALRIGSLGMGLVTYCAEAKRLAPQTNLRPFPETVTDAQILAVINDPQFPTRQEQADRLGIEKRTLERRLAKILPNT